MSRWTLTAICKESANTRRLSNCCARREASAPPWVYALTNLWRISQVVTPPPPLCKQGQGRGSAGSHFWQTREGGERLLNEPSLQRTGRMMAGHASGPDLRWTSLPYYLSLGRPPPNLEGGTHPLTPCMRSRGEGGKVLQPFPLGRTGKGRELFWWPRLLPRLAGQMRRHGGRNLTEIGPRGPWPGAGPPTVPLPPVGPKTLAVSLAWGEWQRRRPRWVGWWGRMGSVPPPPQCKLALGRGASVDQNVPRVLPWGGWLVRTVEFFLPAPPLLQSMCGKGSLEGTLARGRQTGVWGVHHTRRPKFCQGFPPIFHLQKIFGPVASHSDLLHPLLCPGACVEGGG